MKYMCVTLLTMPTCLRIMPAMLRHTHSPYPHGGVIRCLKCDGFMCFDRFSEVFHNFAAWHCVNCGFTVDPTISHNPLHCRIGLTFPKARALKADRATPRAA